MTRGNSNLVINSSAKEQSEAAVSEESELPAAEAATMPEPALAAAETRLAIGDRIVLRYIDKSDARPIFYVITNAPSDPKAGVLNILSPLAQQLSEIEVGDEFVFHAGSIEQRILFVAKQSAASMAMAAE